MYFWWHFDSNEAAKIHLLQLNLVIINWFSFNYEDKKPGSNKQWVKSCDQNNQQWLVWICFQIQKLTKSKSTYLCWAPFWRLIYKLELSHELAITNEHLMRLFFLDQSIWGCTQSQLFFVSRRERHSLTKQS